jgi:hypothetical protein
LLRSRPAEPRRFFFVHMQKTGGISLYMRIARYFGGDPVYPIRWADGDPVKTAPQLMTDVLLDRWQARRDQIQVVFGHFPLCVTELLDAEFTTLTALRDPVDRTLSYLRHHRHRTPEDSEKSLEEIYEDPIRFRLFIHNHMTKMLSLRRREMTHGMVTAIDLNARHLRRAKRALRRIDEFGVAEDLEDFAGRLEDRFGWELGDPVRLNATEPEDVPDSFRARIAEDNALDVELYEYALELLSKRGREVEVGR